MWVLIAVLAFSSCKKEGPAAKVQYNVRMTDAPGPYSEVNIDLQAVEITGAGNHAVMMNVNPGIYNLLDFANGVDTLIATGQLEVGKVSQIRLILGPNNSVKVNGTLYPLSTPSAQQSGLKLQVHQELQEGVTYNVLLDFDANQSVVEEGNGKYSLKPVIRTVQTAMSGAIKGKISAAVAASVTATSSGGVSYSTTVNAQGEFLVQGLPPGTYSLNILPVAPYTQANLSNISVTVGTTTDVGILTI